MGTFLKYRHILCQTASCHVNPNRRSWSAAPCGEGERPSDSRLTHQVVCPWQFFAVSMRGEKVVESSEAPNPGFSHMEGRMIEISREGCQVQVFDILYGLEYGLKFAGAGKGPELAQAYLKGLDAGPEKLPSRHYSKNFSQYR
jgi:hypothetical protein